MPVDSGGRPGARHERRFGEWQSPISAALIAENGVQLAQPRTDGQHIYWLETRPAEQGRTVLMCRARNGAISEMTPADLSVRSRVHEYGGGAYCHHGPRVWFVNDSDQCIYERTGFERCRRLSAPGTARYADLLPDLARGRLLAVQELHDADGAEPLNRLVAIDLASGEPRVLVDDFDFVSSPTLSADARRLAWIGWRHPNLPWDETQLWVAELDAQGGLRAARRLRLDRPAALSQPRWGVDDALYFVSDHSEWWNLYRWNGTEVHSLAPLDAEFGLPQWNFGMSTYGFIDADTLLCAWTRDGLWSIGTLQLAAQRLSALPAPFDAVEHLDAAAGLGVVLAGSAQTAPAIISVDAAAASFSVVRASRETAIESGWISVPRSLEFPSTDGESAHALYYPPANANYRAPAGERPPLLVKCHGGPTSAAGTMQNLRTQFWTSRGFAVLDVNYRGSTGYGRSFRRKLYGRWGIADVADCVAGALYVCAGDSADRQRAVISGGSAGGYVVLCALAFHDLFAAGASYFGIGDLRAMFAETHKFESRYDHWLIGPPAERDALAAARSPALHADRIDRPVLLLQGLEDKVVPPAQAEQLAATLRRNGTPVCYLAFAGEAHGFRRAATIRRALEAELVFYARVLGFTPAGSLADLCIENLPP